MDIVNEEFRNLKQKKLILNILSEILLVIGGILFFRQNNTFITQTIGIFIFVFGIGIWIMAVVFRNTKKYRKLEKDESEPENIKEIISDFGLGMTFSGLIFIFVSFFGGLLLFYALSHSWIKVIFYVLAYELVTDLHSYNKLKSI